MNSNLGQEMRSCLGFTDFLVFCEKWLHDNIPDEDFQMDGTLSLTTASSSMNKGRDYASISAVNGAQVQ